ncbi:MAG TPA: LodA/GoxA family CTQ-dependent oxidase [Vicinamibacterales bacterium]|nr:LodA/GoxA family CTQ-dependent oxidase [Vicinamibacterales bacterium]
MTTASDRPVPTRAFDPADIAYCRIHPGLGIARVGDSEDQFFIGPESPGHMAHPVGGFKDQHGRIKRQAARFRVYAYNAAGEAIAELTADRAEIKWSVQLANKKAGFEMFLGRYWAYQYPEVKAYADEHFDGRAPLRNQEISDADQRRRFLEIRPEPKSIMGSNEHGEQYQMIGTFGPLPYTVVNAQTRDALNGSRSGFLNVPFVDPGDADATEQFRETARKYHWKPGVLQQPVAESPAVEVYLGELRTDAHGRLLVLGGRGVSRTVIPENPVGYLNGDMYFGSNDYWYDDTSDGRVSADVTLKDGRKIEVRDQSWVLVTPPKFAPHAEPLTTLWDTSLQAVDVKELAPPRSTISFLEDIYPVLRRLSEYQWFNQFALMQHGTGKVFDPMSEPLFDQLHQKDPNPAFADARHHVFSRLRKPLPLLQAEHPDLPLPKLITSSDATAWAGMKFMPQMWGDGGDGLDPVGPIQEAPGNESNPGLGIPGGTYVTWAALTPRQYDAMRRWADGDFVDDWPDGTNPAKPPRKPRIGVIPVAQQPSALDRAALEPCVGAPFYPGIEITYISQDPTLWAGVGRLDWRRLEPGDITRYMALPWQADFSECNHRWWPTARPDEVVSQQEYEQVVKFYDQTLDGPLAAALAARVEWARGIPQNSPDLDNGMVAHWSEFGFVVPREGPDEQIVYVEESRDRYAGTSLRDAFYYLMNIGAHSDFLPHARKMVEEFLAQARLNQKDPEVASQQGTGWSPFPYTPEAFDARMEMIYSQYVTQNAQAAGGASGYLEGVTREQAAYRLLQMAPFNQLDGAWIRGAAPPGTVDEVRNLLFSVYMDELGDAIVSRNHANIYTDTLRSLNIYLPEINSRDYAYDPRFLDSAFVEPVFLLAISTFTEEYLPEIIGMTLYLEWSSVVLKSTVAELESFGIDPAYYRLHVGIDNASVGHGALAKKAVALYLDNIQRQGGDEAMQQMWSRIWDGYVAFGTLGTLGQDVADHFAQQPSLSDQMQTMIESKAQYARQNHGTKMLGPNFLNDWFDDPAGLLDALVDGGFIVPGKPDESPIFDLMSFTGPMFHVFTDDEQHLWHDYIASLVPDKPLPKFDLEKAMRYVVNVLRQRQSGTTGHQPLLIGVDPTTGHEVTKPIAWWFGHAFGTEEDNNEALLGALRNPVNGWIVPGDASTSPLITQLLAGNGDMAQAFRDFVPEEVASNAPTPGPYTFKQVLAMWTDAGCPIQGVVEPSVAARKPAPAKARRPVIEAERLAVAGAAVPPGVLADALAAAKSMAPPAAIAKPAVRKPGRRIYGMGRPH